MSIRSKHRRSVLTTVIVFLLAAVLIGPELWAGFSGWHFAPPAASNSESWRPAKTPCKPGGAHTLLGAVRGAERDLLWLVLDCANLLLPAPTNLDARAEAAGVRVNWTLPPGATGIDHFEVWRTCNKVSALIPTSVQPPTTTFLDPFSQGSPVAAYVYRVRGVDTVGNVSPLSNSDLSVTKPFVETVTAQVTTVKAQHFTELRDDVNAVRGCAGLSAVNWAEALVSQVTIIKASHIQELRNTVNPARTTLGLSSQPWTDEPLGNVFVKKQHLEELRLSVQ